MQTPPAGALTWPSSEVPVPNAITGTPCLAQIRTTSWISEVSCAITTASGGCGGSQVVVCACCSRTACEVTSRLPNRAASASIVPASACGSGRFRSLVVVVVQSDVLPDLERPWQRIYRGSRDRIEQTGMDDDRHCRHRRSAAAAAAPFLSSVMQIEPQWIDYNGHLNMAYYNVMFDRAIDELWLQLGIGPGYMKERHGSTFTAECHVRYLREIHLGDPVQVSILLVAADEKRLHTFEELRHATEGWLSATSENMTHSHRHDGAKDRAVSAGHPRPHRRPWSTRHAAVARPEGIGRKIAMPSK